MPGPLEWRSRDGIPPYAIAPDDPRLADLEANARRRLSTYAAGMDAARLDRLVREVAVFHLRWHAHPS